MTLSIFTILDGSRSEQWSGLNFEGSELLPENSELCVIRNGPQPLNSKPLPHFAREIVLEAHRTISEAFNIAAESSDADYFFFLSHPRSEVRGIEHAVEFLEKTSTAAAYAAQITAFNELIVPSGHIFADGFLAWPQKYLPKKIPSLAKVSTTGIGSSLGLLIKRDIFLSCGGFSTTYSSQIYSDADLSQKITARNLTISFSPDFEVELYGKNKSELWNLVDSNNSLDQYRLASVTLSDHNKTTETAKANLPQVFKKFPFENLRIGIHTPFAISPGGGERYILTLLKAFEDAGAAPDLVLPRPFSSETISTTLEALGLGVKPPQTRLIQQLENKPYDVFISMGNDLQPETEGLGRINFYHCQFPFPLMNKKTTNTLASYQGIIANSAFTARAITQGLRAGKNSDIPIQIISPPVPQFPFSQDDKDPFQILSVGRFFVGDHSKQQDKLIEAFKALHDRDARYRLTFVGSISPGSVNDDFVAQCLFEAKGYPIAFHFDAPADLTSVAYKNAGIYWHGTGLDIDQETHPERTEHFGISIVEAMSAGAIPFVVKNGGPTEFVSDGENGFFYSTKEELVSLTLHLGSLPLKQVKATREKAHQEALNFTETLFLERFAELVFDQIQISQRL